MTTTLIELAETERRQIREQCFAKLRAEAVEARDFGLVEAMDQLITRDRKRWARKDRKVGGR